MGTFLCSSRSASPPRSVPPPVARVPAVRLRPLGGLPWRPDGGWLQGSGACARHPPAQGSLAVGRACPARQIPRQALSSLRDCQSRELVSNCFFNKRKLIKNVFV